MWFGLRCERPRCQIASDVGRAMRTAKSCDPFFLEPALQCIEVAGGQDGGQVSQLELCFAAGRFIVALRHKACTAMLTAGKSRGAIILPPPPFHPDFGQKAFLRERGEFAYVEAPRGRTFIRPPPPPLYAPTPRRVFFRGGGVSKIWI